MTPKLSLAALRTKQGPKNLVRLEKSLERENPRDLEMGMNSVGTLVKTADIKKTNIPHFQNQMYIKSYFVHISFQFDGLYICERWGLNGQSL